MRPFIRDGDILGIQPAAAADVRVGDVVFFQAQHGNVLAHRLVRRATHMDGTILLIARGDATSRCDAPVRPEQLLGKVVNIERRGERIELDRGVMSLLGPLWARLPLISLRAYPLWRRSTQRVMRLARRVGHLVGIGRNC
jgi:hypothetical protein